MDVGEVKTKSNSRPHPSKLAKEPPTTSVSRSLVSIANATVVEAPKKFLSSNPPPLVFFPKTKPVERKCVEHRLEPPPLVPISSKK